MAKNHKSDVFEPIIVIVDGFLGGIGMNGLNVYEKLKKKGNNIGLLTFRVFIIFGLAFTIILVFMFIRTVVIPVLQGKPIPGLNK